LFDCVNGKMPGDIFPKTMEIFLFRHGGRPGRDSDSSPNEQGHIIDDDQEKANVRIQIITVGGHVLGPINYFIHN
jgi:hypothetical protein